MPTLENIIKTQIAGRKATGVLGLLESGVVRTIEEGLAHAGVDVGRGFSDIHPGIKVEPAASLIVFPAGTETLVKITHPAQRGIHQFAPVSGKATYLYDPRFTQAVQFDVASSLAIPPRKPPLAGLKPDGNILVRVEPLFPTAQDLFPGALNDEMREALKPLTGEVRAGLNETGLMAHDMHHNNLVFVPRDPAVRPTFSTKKLEMSQLLDAYEPRVCDIGCADLTANYTPQWREPPGTIGELGSLESMPATGAPTDQVSVMATYRDRLARLR